jgi:hypothetical protein
MESITSKILVVLLLIGIILFIVGCMSSKSSKRLNESYEGGYGWPYDLPPLNYYTGVERDILSFWYDPVVDGDDHKDTTWGFSRALKPGYETNIDQVFGPDSYPRYYAEDINPVQS